MSAALKIPAEPTPRQVLREKIAARDAIVRKMSEATKARSESEKAVQRAQADLDQLAANESRQWGAWVADRSRPRPDVQHRRAELEAIRAAAQRDLAEALREYDEIEQKAAADLPGAQTDIVAAADRVVFEEIEAIGNSLREATELAQRLDSALRGVQSFYSRRRDGSGVARAVLALRGNQTIADAERRNTSLGKESAAIRTRWQRLGERLLADPDAKEDLT